ncbi:histidine phosphatase super family protein [Synechococcus sp. PROS-7-1]|uniref:SixA phosphatase family protein n=1 Tax=Synechococcus sp. PROS-7-1 TaxID=1442556 RepID=UPI001645B45A|nr:histidine phosphatase family protein [Synechococcus sp. PROS-7-1]QNI86352.1 histidine phosphatase super family protein [Synechococcus sp. PROS-7-1]
MPDSVSVDLFLFRHGIAIEREHGQDHPDRPLTTLGVERTLAVANRLQALGYQADQMLCSPYRRAVETADLAVQAGLASAKRIEATLAPGGDPRPLVRSLRGRCLLVGHEPDLSVVAAALIGAAPGGLRLRKAGFCHLSWDALHNDPFGHAELQALLKPRLLLPSSD